MPSMGNAAAELQVVVGADTSQAEAGISKLSGSFGTILGAGVAAAGAAVAAGVAVGVKAAGDLQQAVANISTIKPEIDTSAVFDALNEMSTRIPQSASELGASLYDIFSSVDVSTGDALKLLETFGKGAVGAQTDAKTFGTSIMGVMNAYGLSVGDAAHISDVFFNTVNKGVVTGEELAASLGPVTQAAKSAGVGIDELGAMIAAVTKEGGPAAQNINNLNNFLQKITTTSAQDALHKLGVATTTATGAFRPTADVLTDLKAKLAGMSEAAKVNALQAIFPDAQARQGAMTLLSQLDLVKSVTEENTKASGVAEAAYATMSATFNSQSKLLMQGLTAILTTVGAQILPMLTPLVTAFSQSLPSAFQAATAAVAPFVEIFQTRIVPAFEMYSAILVQAIGGTQNLIPVLAGLAAAIGTLLVISAVTAAFSAVAGAITLLLSPIGLVVAAIALLTAAWVGNWGDIQGKTQAVIEFLTPYIQQALAAIQQFWTDHGAQIMAAAQAAWDTIVAAVSGAISIISDLIAAATAAWNGDWAGAWAALQSAAATAWAGIQAVVGAALAVLGALFAPAWSAITATVQAALDGISMAISTAWNGIVAAIQGALAAIGQAITDGWNTILATITGIVTSIRDAVLAVWNLLPEDIRADLELIAATLIERGAAWVASMVATGQQILESITTSGAAWVASIVATGQAILAAVTAWVTATLAAVTTWATTFLASIQSVAGPAVAAAMQIGQGIQQSISQGLSMVLSQVGQWAGQFVSALRSVAGQVVSAAQEIGRAIAQGIASGISAATGFIRDAAYRAAQSALSAAKSSLGIHSPSSVFREQVGAQIPAGIIAGIEDMTRPLAQTMAGLVAPPKPVAMAMGSGYGGGGGTTVVVNVYGNALASRSEIADAVVVGLQAAQRQGRTRVRVT